MNPLSAAIAGYLCLVLDMSLSHALELGDTGVAPGFVLPLVVWLALSASHRSALWAALALGAAVDLASPVRKPLEAGYVLGPNALGFLAAAYLVITIRGTVMRRNPLALVTFTLIGGLLAALVAVALLFIRSKLDGGMSGFYPTSELLKRAGAAAYSMISAAALAVPFRLITPLMGFDDPMARRRPY
ncbi:MAG: hypothetical protein ACREJO_17910 [Phycisphaerales bacterium]